VWSAVPDDIQKWGRAASVFTTEGVRITAPGRTQKNQFVDLSLVDVKPQTLYLLEVDVVLASAPWELIVLDQKTIDWLCQMRLPAAPDAKTANLFIRIFDTRQIKLAVRSLEPGSEGPLVIRGLRLREVGPL
jgi:hypothetical protein